MGVFKFFICSLLAVCAVAQDATVKSKFEELRVVPDVIDVSPNELIKVTYPSGTEAELGNELTPTQVKEKPTLNWNADKDALYTLLFTDPDAPVPYKEFRHWLVVNIPGNDVSKGQTVFDYIGSGPPKGTGLHRYVFLVFKQSKAIETSTSVSNTSRDGRPGTNTRDLIKEYDLGTPVAGNFYRAQYDDYVPILHAQLGGAPKVN